MATTEFTRGINLTERLRFRLEAVAERVADLWQALKNRRAAAALQSWDNRMLGDIGLTRGDVESAFSGGLAEDPTYRLMESRRARRDARRGTRLG